MLPVELRNDIKGRTSEYLNWLRRSYHPTLWPNKKLVSPKWDFVFKPYYHTLNFHPKIEDLVIDLLSGEVERKYADAASEIAVHDFIGHMASSQALCWNIVLPMKKHDNFTPLFSALEEAMHKDGLDIEFDFGIETAAVLELNVAQDLGEKGSATSIDLYLRTAQGRVCAIEFKLTEPDFGQCRQPSQGKCDGRYGSQKYLESNMGYLCYLSKQGRRYWHLGAQYNVLDPTKIAGAQADPIERCPLNVFYQAMRNLLVAKKRSGEMLDGPIRGIFVLAADERNDAFFGPRNHLDSFKEYLKKMRHGYCPDVFRISIQDIVSKFTGALADYKEFFKIKYGIT